MGQTTSNEFLRGPHDSQGALSNSARHQDCVLHSSGNACRLNAIMCPNPPKRLVSSTVGLGPPWALLTKLTFGPWSVASVFLTPKFALLFKLACLHCENTFGILAQLSAVLAG